jgi:hypothetical protein
MDRRVWKMRPVLGLEEIEGDQKENEGLAEEVLQEKSGIREYAETKNGKGVRHRRHDKRNEVREKQHRH